MNYKDSSVAYCYWQVLSLLSLDSSKIQSYFYQKIPSNKDLHADQFEHNPLKQMLFFLYEAHNAWEEECYPINFIQLPKLLKIIGQVTKVWEEESSRMNLVSLPKFLHTEDQNVYMLNSIDSKELPYSPVIDNVDLQRCGIFCIEEYLNNPIWKVLSELANSTLDESRLGVNLPSRELDFWYVIDDLLTHTWTRKIGPNNFGVPA